VDDSERIDRICDKLKQVWKIHPNANFCRVLYHVVYDSCLVLIKDDWFEEALDYQIEEEVKRIKENG